MVEMGNKIEFMKALIWLVLAMLGVFVVLLFASMVAGIEVCNGEIAVNEKCEIIIGPTVNASDISQVFTDKICNISIYNSTDAVVDNVQMENGTYGSGMHNYTFSSGIAGAYYWSAVCEKDGEYGRESGFITVNESTQELIKTYHGTGNYNETADVSNLATSAEVQSVNQTVKDVNSSIISHGDSNWVGSANPSITAGYVWNYTSRTLSDYDTLADYVWNHTTRTLTSFANLVSEIWSAILGSGSSANETISAINESVWYQELYCCD